MDKKPIVDTVLEDTLRQDRANEAWAEYVMNKNPAALAGYLHCGGDVTEEVRKTLIKVLRSDTRGRKGGSKPFRDWQTYLSVEILLNDDSIDRSLRKIDTEQYSAAEESKPMSRRQALQKYANDTKKELRTIELQYERGKKIDTEFH